jgi:catechol 2,3-dioxygenase-like lactoylglutathione lyase family enzyme
MKDIRHSGICCDDLEKANFFYQKLLGLKYMSTGRESGEFIEDLLGLESLTWVKLATDNGDLLELYWLPNKNTQAYNHVAFTVDNLTRIRNKLVEYEIRCSEIKIDASKKHKVMFLKDPDNNLLELVENIYEQKSEKKSNNGSNLCEE